MAKLTDRVTRAAGRKVKEVETRILAAEGRKRLLVITPAFVTDCLETLEEIRVRGAEDFKAAGGAEFTHIPCLNEHPAFIDFLAKRTERWLTPTHA